MWGVFLWKEKISLSKISCIKCLDDCYLVYLIGNYFGFIRVRGFGVDFVVVFDVLESVIY